MKTGLFIALALFFATPVCFASNSNPTVKKIEFSKNKLLEITFDKLGAPKEISAQNNLSFKSLALENPDRLVIDIKEAKLFNEKYQPILPGFASSFRNRADQKNLRLVFDLKQKLTIKKSYFQPNSLRLIIEFELAAKNDKKNTKEDDAKTSNNLQQTKSDADFIISKVDEFEIQTKKVQNPDGTNKFVVTKTPIKRKPIIVIDAGHGGKDPGTIGKFARTKEKDITLAYSKELAKQLMNTEKYIVFLTRDKDIFLPLKTRVEKARRRKADLFISIHVNAIDDHKVSGFSIYTLSETSSDKQAELLAQKENRADIINGVDFSGASHDIMKTLIDMSQRESKNSSSKFANTVIGSVKKSEIEILQNTHRYAGFAVLTAPDMASVLIELGYLSNKQEEKLLNSLIYKRKIAETLTKSIDSYFEKNRI
jgi:N-acetylmuramoyl-L-alanine amidase